MYETEQLTAFLEQLKSTGENAVMATVVRTSGSTYRKEGAKLVISESGQTVGSISAGCLENDVLEIVPQILENSEARLLRYDNTAAEDIIWGLGLGCNGIVEVLVEPVDITPEFDWTETLRAALDKEQAAVVTRFLPTADNTRLHKRKLLIHADGTTRFSLGDPMVDNWAANTAIGLLERRSSATVKFEAEGQDSHDVFFDVISPAPRLVIVGADPDSIPIVAFGRQLGFRVVIVDHRAAFANPERYPQADETIVCWPEELPAKLKIDSNTWLLIKTHNYLRDKDILKFALNSDACYVGQLGPNARVRDLMSDLAKDNVLFADEQLTRLYAPVGLDIGAESPEQIAMSILSEMIAIYNRRQGGFLRAQDQAIHPRQ